MFKVLKWAFGKDILKIFTDLRQQVQQHKALLCQGIHEGFLQQMAESWEKEIAFFEEKKDKTVTIQEVQEHGPAINILLGGASLVNLALVEHYLGREQKKFHRLKDSAMNFIAREFPTTRGEFKRFHSSRQPK